jgi:tellurite resistance protein TerC
VLGAIVMRGALIAGGIALVHAVHGVLYVFGAILLWSGIKMLRADDEGVEPEKNPILRLVRKWFPITPEPRASAIWVREPNAEGRVRTIFTPLFVVLVFVELSDLVFAVDSIPAVFAVTNDGMVAYTSNIFAILGLRALYFLLAVVVNKLRFLKIGLSAILIFIGLKMLLEDFIRLSPGLSLAIVATMLALATLASLLFPPKPAKDAAAEPEAPAQPARSTTDAP